MAVHLAVNDPSEEETVAEAVALFDATAVMVVIPKMKNTDITNNNTFLLIIFIITFLLVA